MGRGAIGMGGFGCGGGVGARRTVRFEVGAVVSGSYSESGGKVIYAAAPFCVLFFEIGMVFGVTGSGWFRSCAGFATRRRGVAPKSVNFGVE